MKSAKPLANADNRRSQTLRRQANEAFSAPDGSFSISKTIAIFAQVATLYHFGKFFEKLIERPESLLIILTFLIAPDVIKKALSMKYGNGHAKEPK